MEIALGNDDICWLDMADQKRNSSGMFKRSRVHITIAAVFLVFGWCVPAMAETIRIVALGDSLTSGYGLPLDESFPVRLQGALEDQGIAVEIANAGVSGDTSTGALARLDWAIAPDTDAVIVELGANDALRGIDPTETRRALSAILQELGARGLPVLLAGMLAPPNMGPDYQERFDVIYDDLAQIHGVVLYPFFLDGVAAQRELNQDDGMHPNAQGVDRIVQGILPFVLELITAVEQLDVNEAQ
jgi:acyl-CoA thioesterase-1